MVVYCTLNEPDRGVEADGVGRETECSRDITSTAEVCQTAALYKGVSVCQASSNAGGTEGVLISNAICTADVIHCLCNDVGSRIGCLWAGSF